MSRKEDQAKYGSLYTRTTLYPLDECVYCGGPRQCLDHVPPISKAANLDIKKYTKRGGKFLLYPSCAECNSMLKDYPEIEIIDRMNRVIDRCEKKIKNKDVWSEEEIEELGPTLRSLILKENNTVKWYVGKQNDIISRMDDIWLTTSDEE